MPRQPYPPSRRIYMQAALCAVFLASVGLAELSVRHHLVAGVVGSSEPVHFGRGSLNGIVRLPADWVMKVKRDGASPTVFAAQEPDTPEHEGRSLVCRVKQLLGPISPIEYLQTGDILQEDARIIRTNSGPGILQITIGGFAGVMLQVARETAETSENQWIACTVLPTGQAVTLIMDCAQGDDSETDRDTFQAILSSVEFRR